VTKARHGANTRKFSDIVKLVIILFRSIFFLVSSIDEVSDALNYQKDVHPRGKVGTGHVTGLI
jgi:hypothetical protein